MLQFNTSGYECSYIQNLLYNFYIPTVPFYKTEQEAVASGMLLDNDIFITPDSRYRIENGKPVRIGSYVFGKYYNGITRNYVSPTNYYSSELHERLGDYWRFYCKYNNLPLMGLYNCYSNRYVDNVALPLTVVEDTVEIVSYRYQKINNETKLVELNEYKTVQKVVSAKTSVNKKVVAVKVQPNTEYYICLQGANTSTIQCGLYDGRNLVQAGWVDSTPVGATLTYAVPFVYKTPELEPEVSQFRDCFYMFISIDVDNIYPIVVVERDETLVSNNSLLETTVDSLQKVYSDKFFSYLCGHVITPLDTIHQNIAKVQVAVDSTPTGIFDEDTKQKLYNRFRFANVSDYTGFVDRDIEEDLGLI